MRKGSGASKRRQGWSTANLRVVNIDLIDGVSDSLMVNAFLDRQIQTREKVAWK